MIIKVLSENTTVSVGIGSEHGLSLYIEAGDKKLLFDTGASGLFAENAGKMNVDIAAVDIVVISHGHYDHGGGLETLLEKNKTARVYVRDNAFEPHYAARPNGEVDNIGLNKTLRDHDQLVLTGDSLTLGQDMELFSGVQAYRFNPSGNIDLLMKSGDFLVRDDFSHEQNLLVRDNGKTVLFAGCAHSGIVNIIEHCRNNYGAMPDVVIGGFHLFNPNTKENESPAVVAKIGKYLLETGARFYTCHCTGRDAFTWLKDVLGDRVAYLSGGSDITL